MRLKPKKKRSELQVNVSDIIADDNEIRLIDAFVSKLDIPSFGIKYKTEKADGKDLGGPPEYDPRDYLRLYIYGYLNKIRSCRDLSKACMYNVEVMWLLNGQDPKRNAINDFRSSNSSSLLEIFKSFNSFWQYLGLFGAASDIESAQSQAEAYLTFAIDSSYFGGQNSKSNNYNEEKIAQGLERWNKKAAQYLADLAELESSQSTESIQSTVISKQESKHSITQPDTDKAESDQNKETKESNPTNHLADKTELLSKLDFAQNQQSKYENLKAALQQTGQLQVSTTDPDARRFKQTNKGSIVGYNTQMSCESTHKLVAHFEVTNQGDTNAFYQIAKPSKDFLTKGDPNKKINSIADKKYDVGQQIYKATQYNIITYIAHNPPSSGKKDPNFSKSNFTYVELEDIYRCPEGKPLTTNGKLYTKRNGKIKEYRADFKKDCQPCLYFEQCLAPSNIANKKGRVISRPEYEAYRQANKERVENNKEIYKKRKEIVEHPFGTIKRNWGYTYTLLKGIEKVTGEFALIFTAYNLRRAISILGVNALIEKVNKLESIVFSFFLQNLLVWLSITTVSRNKKQFAVALVKHLRD